MVAVQVVIGLVWFIGMVSIIVSIVFENEVDGFQFHPNYKVCGHGDSQRT